MRATERGKTFGEPLGHVLDGGRRSRCETDQARRDRQQVLDAMSHVPASSSWPSSACLRPVTSMNMPNITRSTMSASAP